MLQDGLCYGSLGCCFATDEAAITGRIRFTGAVSGNNRRWPDKAARRIRQLSLPADAKKPIRQDGLLHLFDAWQFPTLAWGDPTLPSALRRFTSEFGMGSGGTTALRPPGKFCLSDRFCVLI